MTGKWLVPALERSVLPQVSLDISNWHVLGNHWITGNSPTAFSGFWWRTVVTKYRHRATIPRFKTEFFH